MKWRKSKKPVTKYQNKLITFCSHCLLSRTFCLITCMRACVRAVWIMTSHINFIFIARQKRKTTKKNRLQLLLYVQCTCLTVTEWKQNGKNAHCWRERQRFSSLKLGFRADFVGNGCLVRKSQLEIIKLNEWNLLCALALCRQWQR